MPLKPKKSQKERGGLQEHHQTLPAFASRTMGLVEEEGLEVRLLLS